MDHLKLKGDPKATRALVTNGAANDAILWSCAVTKINRKGKHQKRALLITNRHVLNLMPDNYSKCNRCIDLRSVHHLTTAASAQEFAIHVSDEYDYRFKMESGSLLDEVVKVLQGAFDNVKGSPLKVADMDVGALSRQVMTKAVVKRMGSGVWDSVKGSRIGLPGRKGSKKEGKGADEGDEGEDDSADEEDVGVQERREEAEAAGSGAAAAVGGVFTSKAKYTVEDFNIIKVLGKGAFGKVMLVTAKDSGKLYAMKSLSKTVLAERGEVVHTKTERKTLEDTHHPFLVHLHFAFQSPAKLYLVMDYCNGGELFFHLKQTGRFSEPRARLYAAEIASALEHLHERKVVYRDLKPENVLLDHEGHIRITDFGLAKDAMELDDKTHTFCGTPDYLAPEVIKNAGHGRGVDWWSLGTMIYEMLGGLPPFYSENFNVMYDRILRSPLAFRPEAAFTPAARDLLEGLLQKEPEKRLGSGETDGAELRQHAWFQPIDWAKLLARELVPEFRPNVAGATDTSNFDDEFTSQPAMESVAPGGALDAKKGGPNFDGFTFVAASHLK
jgi:serum/glucocorticoid-regulated kinase 2